MTCREPRTQPQPPLRLTMLLVLAVIVGLLGMHALVTAALPSAGATEHTSHHVAAAPAAPGSQYRCPDGDRDTGRHVIHTDQMCASAALPGSPGIAAADTESVTTTAHGAHAPVPWPIAVAHEPAGGRAPPSLAGLQLLRI
ncbi:DUF6153 family protein [Streptomyces sp. NBC_00347]|uniref:DUF6153 family protein n=1 Tax=Streptomyces sp. NBC_00347 TaxID=2975721 RepID=UPI0022525C38|nr:DUF6153 family protein [Streptomyces sp. NBC_00347]MCX5126901.1 DUF6153 family protein [Streptomyces sp. NBC_00347]